MNIRQRLARWLDPSLVHDYDLYWDAMRKIGDLQDPLDKIARTLDRQERRRLTRVIECKHPELHPDGVIPDQPRAAA